MCPTTLRQLHRLHKLLPENERHNLEVVFISVDVERDTLPVIQKHFESFPENFHGGVDTEENLKKILAQFGASYKVFKGKDPNDIAIDHTSLIYVINQNGEWVDSLKYDSNPEALLAAYRSADRLSPLSAPQRKDRDIEVIGENKNCDLAKNPCVLNGYEVSIGPYPIITEKDFEVKVTTTKAEGKPIEMDFEGVENDMGYIHPKLTQTSDQTYTGKFHIPVCELPEMLWKARLILETPTGPKSLVFHFKTFKPVL